MLPKINRRIMQVSRSIILSFLHYIFYVKISPLFSRGDEDFCQADNCEMNSHKFHNHNSHLTLRCTYLSYKIR